MYAFQFFKITLINQKVQNYFRRLVGDTMEAREKKHIVRHDMIHMLMDAKKGMLKHEDDKHGDTVMDGFSAVEESHVGKETVRRSKYIITPVLKWWL